VNTVIEQHVRLTDAEVIYQLSAFHMPKNDFVHEVTETELVVSLSVSCEI
jgi:hypothetical protein